MKLFLSLLCVFIATLESYAQSCTYCNKTPKVANYDFDVLVRKPGQPGDSLSQWYQLFYASKFANAKLFQLNKGCVRFMQPLVKDENGSNVLLVGNTSPMLPKNSEPSKYGDYLVTGEVMQTGTQYTMRMKLLTACEGIVVHSVSVSFTLSGESASLKEAAESAATLALRAM